MAANNDASCDGNPPAVATEVHGGLTFQVLRDSLTGSEAWIFPEVGANCVHFQTTIDGEPLEVIRRPEDWEAFRGHPTFYGAAILFPFPGRIRGGRFSFAGKDYQLPLTEPSGGNAIHGCVSKRPWALLGTASGDGGASATYQIGTDTVPEMLTQYPFPFRLTLTIGLKNGQLGYEFTAENLGDSPMPVGLGLHPYFPLPLGRKGTVEDCEIWIDAPYFWEQENAFPLGTARPAAESVDLRGPRSLRALASVGIGGEGRMINLAHSQFTDGRGPEPTEDGIRWGVRNRVAGSEVVVEADKAFPASVTYVPIGRDKISFEPHTCLPNAFNLASEGKVAGQLTLGPREFWRGGIRISARRISS